MDALAVSLPLFIIVGLGYALMRSAVFTPEFVDGTQAFVYRVSLPSLILASLTEAPLEFAGAWPIILAFLAATAVTLVLCLTGCVLVKMERRDVATVTQASFRGNLAFIGLPVLASAHGFLDDTFLARAVLVFAPMMIFYNVLAVLLFHLASERTGRVYLRAMAGIGSNPLVLAAVVGCAIGAWLPPLPGFLVQTLELLGAPAATLALLCVGAAMAHAPIHDRIGAAAFASVMKVAGLPIAAWIFGRWIGLDREGMQILMVFAACPSAAASYIIARQLGGNAALASNIVVLSTILSPVTVTAAVWIFFP